MSPQSDQQYYTAPQAARLLAVSPSTVWRWIEAGKLRAFRVGGRTIRIKPEDLSVALRPTDGSNGTSVGSPERPFRLPEATPEERLRRRAVIEETLEERKRMPSVAPLTSVGLIRMAREEEGSSYDPGEHPICTRRLRGRKVVPS